MFKIYKKGSYKVKHTSPAIEMVKRTQGRNKNIFLMQERKIQEAPDFSYLHSCGIDFGLLKIFKFLTTNTSVEVILKNGRGCV